MTPFKVKIANAFAIFLAKTDFDLLHTQKMELVNVSRLFDRSRNNPTIKTVDGLINFLDAFQDVCVDELGLWKFPNTESDDEPDLLTEAKKVMELLEEHGPSIVPHLLDTDENPGQRLRDAIKIADHGG